MLRLPLINSPIALNRLLHQVESCPVKLARSEVIELVRLFHQVPRVDHHDVRVPDIWAHRLVNHELIEEARLEKVVVIQLLIEPAVVVIQLVMPAAVSDSQVLTTLTAELAAE